MNAAVKQSDETSGGKPERSKFGNLPGPGPGRPAAVPNKMTVAAKEAFNLAFEGIGGVDGLIKWASQNAKNRSLFYTLYARLIPQTLVGSIGIYDASADAAVVKSKLLSQVAAAVEGEFTVVSDGSRATADQV